MPLSRSPASALVVALALLASACASTAEVVVSGPAGDDAQETPEPEPTPTSVPTSAATATPVPGTAPENDPALLLLQAGDLVGWDYTPPAAMHSAEARAVSDCPLMNTALRAHDEPGTRMSASASETQLRQTVVELDTTEEATGVLDAAAMVWEECTQLGISGALWWSEPVGIPAPTGWRAQALALGSGDTIWIIGWWQRGATVVFVDLEGEQAWVVLQSLFDGIADRLVGEPAQVPPPEPLGSTPGVEPTPVDESVPTPELPRLEPVPLPTGFVVPTPLPTPDEGFPPPGDDWTSHPLAALAIDPDDLGPDWEFQYGTVNEPAPSDPEDVLTDCPVAAPPILDGFTLEYERAALGLDEALELVVGHGDAAGAQETVDAFRAITDCDLSGDGFTDGLSEVPISIEGADDAVVVAGERTDGLDATVYIAIARFGDLSVGIYRGWFLFDAETPEEFVVPTTAEIVDLMEDVASRR